MSMEKGKMALLISTCDKFSDLWDWHFRLLRQHWRDIPYPIYMVTDRKTERKIEGVTIIEAGEELDFPMRIKYALNFIKEKFVLLTLDDYFVVHDVDREKIDYLCQYSDRNGIDYLKLYDRRFDKEKDFEEIDKLHKIDLKKHYAITLYPAIWKKDFLYKTVKDNITPWAYEASLTKTAAEEKAKCMYSQSGTFRILDVVRKGKILHKADLYFKANDIDIGDRPCISQVTEIKLWIMDIISWYTPKPVFKGLKRIGTLMGMKFYSD